MVSHKIEDLSHEQFQGPIKPGSILYQMLTRIADLIAAQLQNEANSTFAHFQSSNQLDKDEPDAQYPKRE
jgi:hypothetical protein